MVEAQNNGMKELSFSDTYIMVAGIDFGTTFSAYAFSFKSSEGEIRMNSNWGAAVGFESYKAPTCVMTKPNGEFHRFGFDAENEFSQLSSDQTDPETGFNLYRHFKMLLHKQGARLSSTVTSTSGNVRPAIEIFTMTLQYLKKHMLEAINKAVTSPHDTSLIRWVVTVPAIWTDESKRFMREAAFRAGLILSVNSKKLMIALEPEAASVFCQSLDSEQFILQRDQAGVKKIKTGEKFMIIDAGGGTIDITAHKLKITGYVEEIIPASGGPWGGMKVDEKFVSLLNQIFGPDFLNNFKANQSNQWLTFLLSFEKAKKSSDPDNETSAGKITIPILWSIATEYSTSTGKSLDKVINENANLGVSFNNGNLVISAEKSKEMFQSVINETIQYVSGLLQDPRLNNLDYILLVGGFGECKYLQKAILDSFSKKNNVLIPMTAQLAIIKGAVMYGHRPEKISSRIARFTYGCEVYHTFEEGKHDPSKAVMRGGIKRCDGMFQGLVNQGKVLKVNDPYKYVFNPPAGDGNHVDFTIYKTDKVENPTYVDESGVVKLGRIHLSNPSGVLGKKLELQMTFGATEILVEGRDVSKGEDFPVSMVLDSLEE